MPMATPTALPTALGVHIGTQQVTPVVCPFSFGVQMTTCPQDSPCRAVRDDSCGAMQQHQQLLVVQVFVSRGHLATCALACAYACELPFMWAPLLAIVQAGIAGLEGLQTLEPAQQQLADDLHKVCPALAPAPALPCCSVIA